LESILPYIPEIISIDIPLTHVTPDGCTTAYSSVASYRSHLYARPAIEKVVPHLALIVPQKTFTGITYINPRIMLPAIFNEVHEPFQLLIA
jgi:hypothetical protein